MSNLTVIVPPSGSIDSEIALVGEAPASREILEQKPFVGTSGYFLDKVIPLAGLTRSELYITNLVKEPAKNYLMFNMPASRIDEWAEYLVDEINSINAKIIVPLGDYALKALTGRSGISKFRGSVMHPSSKIRQNCVVVPTLHPANMSYDYESWPCIVHDLTKAKRICDNFDTFQFPSFNFEIRPTLDQILKRLFWMRNNNNIRMTIDVETYNNNESLSCIGLGWSHSEAICIPFIYGNRENYFTEHEEIILWKALAETLPLLDLNNQNFMFDWEVMLNHGIHLPMPKWDPMLMHHCLYSELSHRLNDIISFYTDMEYYKSDEREEKNGQARKGSSIFPGKEHEHWNYNCRDCVGALWCIDELEKDLNEENMMYVYQNLYQKQFEPYFGMNIHGIRVDVGNLNTHRKNLIKRQNELQEMLNQAARHEINPRSPKQVKEFLIDELSLKGYHKRGSTSYIMDEKHLEKMALQCKSDVPKWIIKIRKISKDLSLFCNENILNGRLHCRYSLGRSTTGRIASRKSISGRGMNLQNVKRGDARMFFVADL